MKIKKYNRFSVIIGSTNGGNLDFEIVWVILTQHDPLKEPRFGQMGHHLLKNILYKAYPIKKFPVNISSKFKKGFRFLANFFEAK